MLKILFTKFIIFYWLTVPAQVQVRDEPRHHNVFENEYLRILDVFLGPKDTTQYHLHNTPSVFIVLANCKVSSQLLGGQPQTGANLAGNISYDALKTERIHRVWNEDTSWFHVLDVELTAKTQKGKTNVLQDRSIQLLFDEQQANGYSIELNPGTKVPLPASSNGYLLISLNSSPVDLTINNITQHRLMKAGHYEWIEQGKQVSLSTIDRSAAKFVLLQLK